MLKDEILKKAVEMASHEPPAQRQVPIGPVPMAWNVSQAQSPEGPLVVVHVQTPEGDKVFFLAASMAKQIGEALVKMGSASDSGLLLAR